MLCVDNESDFRATKACSLLTGFFLAVYICEQEGSKPLNFTLADFHRRLLMVGGFRKVRTSVVILPNFKWLKFLDLTSMTPETSFFFFFPELLTPHIRMRMASFETSYF